MGDHAARNSAPDHSSALWGRSEHCGTTQHESSALFERESRPSLSGSEQLTSDYPGPCAVAPSVVGRAYRASSHLRCFDRLPWARASNGPSITGRPFGWQGGWVRRDTAASGRAQSSNARRCDRPRSTDPRGYKSDLTVALASARASPLSFRGNERIVVDGAPR
jgi:hypothetical protein